MQLIEHKIYLRKKKVSQQVWWFTVSLIQGTPHLVAAQGASPGSWNGRQDGHTLIWVEAEMVQRAR